MDETEQQAFLSRAAAFVELCNSQAKDVPGEKVAMSALYGVTRYCAWLCKRANGSGPEMAGRRAEALKMFSDEFNRMFGDWYDHYAELFDQN